LFNSEQRTSGRLTPQVLQSAVSEGTNGRSFRANTQQAFATNALVGLRVASACAPIQLELILRLPFTGE
jgi:hypothetical protein